VQRAPQHLTIGTAGHVDHGKTTLVRALTGVDTDRLPEEKLREMTIDLGFARFPLPSGREAAIVDVPGHERFVGNMLAGATGVDLVLLVIAADAGVMPQTLEHLDILDLLGLEAGIVVLTKADLVDSEMLALVDEEIGAALAGTSLAGAPRIAVSARTGYGLAELVAATEAAVLGTPGKPTSGPARLPVDRVFTAPGFGTVVTGTLASGRVAIDDRLDVLPAGHKVRVRGIEVHGRRQTEAWAGERTALNLAGLGREEVARGDVVATPSAFGPSTVFDGELRCLARAAKPLQHRQRVHLHTGTSEAVGRILLLEGTELAPGGTGMVQFQSETPLVLGPRDRFIVRSYSPVRTLGGGVVIDAAATPRRRRPPAAAAQAVVARLRELRRGDPLEVAASVIRQMDRAAVAVGRPEAARRLAAELNLSEADADLLLARLVESGRALAIGGGALLLSSASWHELAEAVAEYLRSYHERWPLRLGAAREEVRLGPLRSAPPRQAQAALDALQTQGHLKVARERLALPGFQPAPGGTLAVLADRVRDALSRGGNSPPELTTLAVQLGDPQPSDRTRAAGTRFGQVLEYLVDHGEVVLVAADLGFARGQLDLLVASLAAWLGERGSITVSEFRQLAGTTRKYAVPLLEHFDRMGLTARQGDARIAGPAAAAGRQQEER
jgi:selenocysteine-specific elongation factor